ncbi:MAG TPA: hypothetical protein VJ891_20555 [Casimicrobiaceae bacterium]|nr:hypothetical protein [Casimicrobiaceae bacterium]
MRVAAQSSGTLVTLAVARVCEVTKDAPLFTLESEHERAARAEAEARVRQAQAHARLANLVKARRPPEIAAAAAKSKRRTMRSRRRVARRAVSGRDVWHQYRNTSLAPISGLAPISPA